MSVPKLNCKTLSDAILTCPDFKIKIMDEDGNLHEVKSIFTKGFQLNETGTMIISSLPMKDHNGIIDGTYTLWDESWI